MNYSTAVFLINDKARCVMVNYEPDERKLTPFKTLDASLKINDYVVVPTHTRHGMTVGRIVEIDTDVNFDDPALRLEWVIARVDREPHDKIVEQEKQSVERIKKVEMQRRRDAIMAAVFADPNEAKTLPLASSGGQS